MERVIALLLTVVMAFGQTPSPQPFQAQDPAQPDVVIRISVSLVQVDAVVTDSKGKYITDLKAEDFEILQDGKPQQITNFAYISSGRGTQSRVEKVAVVDKTAPPPPPVQLRPSQVRRTFALVVDDLGLSFESIARVRQSLKKFVDEQMQPGDMVAVIRTGAGMGALQQFTTDKRLLYAAIERVRWNAYGRVGISSFGPITDSEDASDFETRSEEFRETMFSVGTLGAIRFVVNGLRELPGRKAIMLFSENLRMFNSEGMNTQVMDNMRRLTDDANRASVVIHSIDPRGLQTLAFTAQDRPNASNPQRMAEQMQRRSKELWDSQEGTNFLAQETGGLFIHNDNDINASVRKVMEDSEGYYLIGYHPDASTFDEKTGQPKFHSVRVKVKRAGLKVRSRNGFFGTTDRDSRPTPRTRDEQLITALVSPFGSAGIPLRLTALFSNAPKVGSFVTSLLHIDAKALSFTDEPDPVPAQAENLPPGAMSTRTPTAQSAARAAGKQGKQTGKLATRPPAQSTAKPPAQTAAAQPAEKQGDWKKTVLDILVITYGDNGQEVDRSNRTFTIRMRGETLKQSLANGLIYTVRHPIKKPGAYQMRVAVRDATSQKVGAASQYVEVPDVSKGRLLLSGLVLKSFVPQQAQPTPGAPEGKVDEPDPRGSPAMRIFAPGKALTYGFEIINAKTDGKKTDLVSTMRLFREGKLQYEGKPIKVDSSMATDPKHIISGGRLQLGSRMEPGEYILQVTVRDNLAREKNRMASQYMNFEIQR